MNLKLEVEFSKADILKDIDILIKQIGAMRPLPEDAKGQAKWLSQADPPVFIIMMRTLLLQITYIIQL